MAKTKTKHYAILTTDGLLEPTETNIEFLLVSRIWTYIGSIMMTKQATGFAK